MTLFVTILTLFLVSALLVGIGVTTADYIQNRSNAQRVAADAFKEKIGRINERRLAFFAAPFLVLQQFYGHPALRDAVESREDILKPLLPSLMMNPQISAVYVGYESGNFFHVLSISEAEKPFIEQQGGPPATRFALHEIRVVDGVRETSWTFLDARGQQIGALADRAATYDPRSRDWYREARAQPEKMIRTPPYIFAATSQAGMTLSKATEDGVVGVDITLDRLMEYVRSVRSNQDQRFVAFDEQDRLLAHFDPERMFKTSGAGDAKKTELATTADLVDPIVREAVRIFVRQGPYEMARIDVGGSEYLATVVHQVGRDGSGFRILYAAPLSNFMGPLADAAARNILAASLVFLLALPGIIYLAHSISKPLSKLSEEAELIRSFQLAEPIRLESRVREVNALIRSMSGMKGTIREITKFVPKALVRELLQSEGTLEVGGETRLVSILFTDIRDFTEMAGQMPAEKLMINLSEYFDELASLIIRESGTVDKYIGDAVFAFWNAPLPVARHEHAACATALKCRLALRRLNERWMERGLAPWQTRFGVHVGPAVLGNVGSSDRIDYTAIGNTVNIASRLEGLNKHYGTGILASGDIADACSEEFLFRRVDRSQPKGAGQPLDVFELLGMREGPEELRVTLEMTRLVEDWNRVYAEYSRQDWLGTLDALQAFAAQHPADVVAGIYLSRVIGFVLEPPPQNWDRIIHFDQK
ncbi:adenylate/guanylate cyclase domain-containing protein [Bradyrhizobium sp. RT6a]|uniref:adenylate/guanylate cyclase domain-containing protein n=1 Tax=unclassified Bradyrhizobium TaxID=2631580 RepID=UPI003393227E